MSDKVKIVYHKNCVDGFMAAYSSYLYFKDKKDCDVEYIAIAPNSTPHIEDIRDSHIYIFDVSIPYDDFFNWTHLAKSVSLHDHHITNMNILKNLDNCHFDMNESGASLAYTKWFGKENMPWFISYTRDRDLWKLELPSNSEVMAYIMSVPYTFEDYDDKIASIDLQTAIDRGRWILQANEKIINQTLKKKSACKWITQDDHIYDAWIVNSNVFQSEIGNILCNIDPHLYPFAIIWHVEPGLYKDVVRVSLRSTGDFSVAKLAEDWGGGGHKNAAGCTIPWNKFDTRVIKG
jgi:oligoribonuclease NrnB/cAMP/cGMP phosphodiesterase (DHH superfamily)